jgi:twitching motility protein PilI
MSALPAAEFTPDPLLLLRGIEARCRAAHSGIGAAGDVAEEWHGIAFRSAGSVLVAPLDEVCEILAVPPCTRVPGAKPWVRGVANVRGTLLPVMDLGAFVAGTATRNGRGNRLLVVDHQGTRAGLLVEEVQGMVHCLAEHCGPELPDGASAFAPWLAHGLRTARWHRAVFSPNRLASDAGFLQAGA